MKDRMVLEELARENREYRLIGEKYNQELMLEVLLDIRELLKDIWQR